MEITTEQNSNSKLYCKHYDIDGQKNYKCWKLHGAFPITLQVAENKVFS
jgi:hypothetical protein